MKRNTRRRWIGLLSLGLIVVVGIVTALVVFAGTSNDEFTATAYSDVIRFQAEGVATLQVQIYDLSGRELWDSGVVASDIIDWDRRNEFGERLAYGAYLYVAQGWETGGELSFKENGKLALMPGDKVQLQAAPLVTPSRSDDSLAPFSDEGLTVQPKGLGDTGIFGQVGIGTDNPGQALDVHGNWIKVTGPGSGQIGFLMRNATIDFRLMVDAGGIGYIGTVSSHRLGFITGNAPRIVIDTSGNVGIGTTSPTARLEIESSTGQDLIAAYNSSNRVFVVKNTGEVRADGAYYGASFNTGSADVAERINVSEWVEAGYVVEIDPEHPGFFRKSASPYSTKVAGIISTSPGVILGNNFDEATDEWEDNRPVLAVTGRVPCKVSAENGPIEIGDLLVASSTPGIAMKGNPEESMGAVVGKAMETLEQGEGTIVVQVMLR